MIPAARSFRYCRAFLPGLVLFICPRIRSEIPFLQYKRSRKISSDPVDPSKRSFLSSLLQVTLSKMKWDEDSDPDDLDEDDNAEFDKMRKVKDYPSC